MAKYFVQNGLVGVSEEGIKLNSGRISSYYINGRKISTSLARLNEATDFVFEFVQEKGLVVPKLDAVLGVPQGATKLADTVSRKLIENGLIEDQLFEIRIIPKEHGEASTRLWVNGNIPNKLILFEDTVTTGGSPIRFADRFRNDIATRENGIEIVGVVGLVDRLQLADGITAKERFAKEGLRFLTLTDASELLPEFLESMQDAELREEFKRRINQEYRNEYEEADRDSPIEL